MKYRGLSTYLSVMILISMLGLSACSYTTPITAPGASQESNNSSGDEGGGGSDGPGTPGTPQSGLKWTSSCGMIPGVMGKNYFGPWPAQYCIYRNSPNPTSTVWFFHGLGDSEQVFNQLNEKSASYGDLAKGLGPSVIVMVSYGSSWLLTPYSNRTLEPADSTLEIFKTKIVPFIENTVSLPKPYVLMGHSMGGFNASTLCSSLPDMWSKCVLLNAMLPTCEPFSGSYWGTGPDGLPVFCNPGPGMIVEDHFTQAGWSAHKPSVLLQNATRLPKTLVTACEDDDFGLFAGPYAWANQARARGFDVTWLPVLKGSGCTHILWPAAEVIKFMAK